MALNSQFSILYFSHFSIGAGRQMALVTLHNQSVILQETKYK